MRRWHQKPSSRVLAVAALIAVASWLIYVVVANALLTTGYIENRVGKPDERILEIDKPWTLWPGRVHTRDLRVAYAEDDLQFEIAFERATVEIDLGALMRRQLLVHSLSADGMSFRLRRLLERPEEQPLRVRALPKIAGFADDARAKPDQDQAPAGERKLWSFDIRGIDARVRELWVDEFRYRGSGHVRGAFRFAPETMLEVTSSEVALAHGTLGFGELRPIAPAISGSISGHLRELDIRENAELGWRTFRHISLRGTLAAEIADLDFTDAYTRGSRLSLAGGRGQLGVVLALERGEFTPEARVEYQSPRLELDVRELSLSGDARVLIDTRELDGVRRGRLQIAGERIALGAGGSQPIATLRDLDLALFGSSVDLTRKWRAEGGSIAIGSFAVPDLKRVNRLKNGGKWQLAGGALSATATATLERDGALSGDLRVRLSSARARFGKIEVGATGTASAGWTQPNLRTPNGQIENAELELSRFSFSTPTGSSGPGTLSASSRRIELRKMKPRRFAVSFASRFESADGVLDALDVASSGAARIARWFVDLENLSVRGSARYDAGKLSVEIDRAVTDGAEVSGKLEKTPRGERSKFDIDLGLFELSKSTGR